MDPEAWEDWLNPVWDSGGVSNRRWVRGDRRPWWSMTEPVDPGEYDANLAYAAPWALGAVRHLAEREHPTFEHHTSAANAVRDCQADCPVPDRKAFREGEAILSRSVLEATQEVWRRLEAFGWSLSPEELATHTIDGVLWADEVVAVWLAEHSAQDAEAWREASREKAREDLFGPARGRVWRGMFSPPATAKDEAQSAVWYQWVPWVADTLWREEIWPDLYVRWHKREAQKQTVMLHTVAHGVGLVGTSHGDAEGVWQVTPELAEAVASAAPLASLEAQVVVRRLPDLAKVAAHRGMVRITEGMAPGHEVVISPTVQGRTEVTAIGGWSALTALFQASNQHRMTETIRTLAAYQLVWCEPLGAQGRTSLIADIVEGRGDRQSVSFILPMLFHPDFASMLKRDHPALTRHYRGLVPISPSLPPAKIARKQAAASRLEILAVEFLREHLDDLTEHGGVIPWEGLARQAELSTARQPSRLRKAVTDLLDHWVSEGRWIRTGDRWRMADEDEWGVLRARKKDRRKRQKKAISRRDK